MLSSSVLCYIPLEIPQRSEPLMVRCNGEKLLDSPLPKPVPHRSLAQVCFAWASTKVANTNWVKTWVFLKCFCDTFLTSERQGEHS